MNNDNVVNIDSANIPQDIETSVKIDSVTSDNVIIGKNGLPRLTAGKKPITNKLTEEFLEDVTMYASQSITNQEVSKLLNISTRSFYRLIADNQDFIQAYNKGIDNRKYALEKALLKRAEGFTAEETQTVVTQDPEKGTIVKNTVTQKNYVPDSTALIFSLKNLYSDKYKDRIESVSTVNVNVQQLQNLPDEELLKYIKIDEIDYNIE